MGSSRKKQAFFDILKRLETTKEGNPTSDCLLWSVQLSACMPSLSLFIASALNADIGSAEILIHLPVCSSRCWACAGSCGSAIWRCLRRLWRGRQLRQGTASSLMRNEPHPSGSRQTSPTAALLSRVQTDSCLLPQAAGYDRLIT